MWTRGRFTTSSGTRGTTTGAVWPGGEPARSCGTFRLYWFVDTAQYVARAHDAFPFAARILPGFHPWNVNTRKPNYLPRYLDEQLSRARDLAHGCWLYTEGLGRGADPRLTLDAKVLRRYAIDPQEYIDVLRRHPTRRVDR